ncbi:MAG: cytochrome c biogenesis protein CcsA [Paraprevotella sp.]|nr:cytochrome c biogenesis protein CcsA [Paraprevotella sp.]
MKTVPFILLLIAAAVIGIATFVEDAHGTLYAQTVIYGSLWFKLLWTVIIVATAALIVRRKAWRSIPVLLLHLSFGVIFAGALTTAFTGRKGMLHLRQGSTTEEYADEQKRIFTLPFVMRLDSFYVEYYAGTEAPADYVSQITCLQSDGVRLARPRISMNRIFSRQGYRFYQSSYDEDMKGSWLTVNYDPWGTAITYAGFILFGLSCLLMLCARIGEFRRLLRHPLLKKGGLFLLAGFWAMQAQADPPLPVVKRVQADSLAAKQVIYNERVAPLNTLAKDFVQKLYGRPTYRGLSPEQVVSSWMLYPEEWSHVPIIRIKSRELRTTLRLQGDYAALTDLFDGTQYKLQSLWQHEQNRQSKLGKAIQETDEKVGLILMLTQGTLIRPVPAGTPRLSTPKVKAELLYNRIPFSKILAMTNLTLGIVAFGLLLYRMLKNRRAGIAENRLWTALLYLATAFHAFGYALRGYVSGSLPLSNGYETMQFVVLPVLLTACLLHRRFPYTRPFGFLLSGFILLVAHLGEMNPQITPLMPVLSSPWLSYHVSFIMISYALFAFVWLNAILALCLMGRRKSVLSPLPRERVEQLTLLSRILLYPATFLLGVGIVMGAVWANVSWGSYWFWDPKEVWALAAFIIYGLSFHRSLLPWLRHPRAYHIYMIVAFAVVLMTYFGVNYLLGGMHSYANA